MNYCEECGKRVTQREFIENYLDLNPVTLYDTLYVDIHCNECANWYKYVSKKPALKESKNGVCITSR